MSVGSALSDYYFHGFRLRSAIPLATVPLWPIGQETTVPQLHFLAGEASTALIDPVFTSPYVQIGRDCSALITCPPLPPDLRISALRNRKRASRRSPRWLLAFVATDAPAMDARRYQPICFKRVGQITAR
jgi:hypothetical protein